MMWGKDASATANLKAFDRGVAFAMSSGYSFITPQTQKSLGHPKGPFLKLAPFDGQKVQAPEATVHPRLYAKCYPSSHMSRHETTAVDTKSRWLPSCDSESA